MLRDYYRWKENRLESGSDFRALSARTVSQSESGGLQPFSSLGELPARTSQGPGTAINLGAQVGIVRNLEFTAGNRSHRVITGPYTRS